MNNNNRFETSSFCCLSIGVLTLFLTSSNMTSSTATLGFYLYLLILQNLNYLRTYLRKYTNSAILLSAFPIALYELHFDVGIDILLEHSIAISAAVVAVLIMVGIRLNGMWYILKDDHLLYSMIPVGRTISSLKMSLFTMIIAAFLEEYYFREFLFQLANGRVLVFLVLSPVIFVLAHNLPSWARGKYSKGDVIYQLLFSLISATTLVYVNTWWVCVFLHLLVNAPNIYYVSRQIGVLKKFE